MKYFVMMIQIIGLYLIYCLGSLIQELLNIPLPGSLIGMLVLYVMLQLKIIKEKWLAQGSKVLLAYLSLLFVPATVGIVDYLSLFKGKGLLTLGIALFSTFLVMTVSSVVGQAIAKREAERKSKDFDRSVEM